MRTADALAALVGMLALGLGVGGPVDGSPADTPAGPAASFDLDRVIELPETGVASANPRRVAAGHDVERVPRWR